MAMRKLIYRIREAAPNWVEQELRVYGPANDLDAFCARAVTGSFAAAARPKDQASFLFDRACPRRGNERKIDEPRVAMLHRFVRSNVEALFDLETGWKHPTNFYTQRLVREWPTLSFSVAVSEDMGNFGGVIVGIQGEVTDLVWPQGRLREQRRRVRSLLSRWRKLTTSGRPWILTIPPVFRKQVRFPVDGVFTDEYAFGLYLQDEKDVRALLRTRKVTGVWHRGPRGQLRRVTLRELRRAPRRASEPLPKK
jgi:hypothetical protein